MTPFPSPSWSKPVQIIQTSLLHSMRMRGLVNRDSPSSPCVVFPTARTGAIALAYYKGAGRSSKKLGDNSFFHCPSIIAFHMNSYFPSQSLVTPPILTTLLRLTELYNSYHHHNSVHLCGAKPFPRHDSSGLWFGSYALFQAGFGPTFKGSRSAVIPFNHIYRGRPTCLFQFLVARLTTFPTFVSIA